MQKNMRGGFRVDKIFFIYENQNRVQKLKNGSVSGPNQKLTQNKRVCFWLQKFEALKTVKICQFHGPKTDRKH